VAIAKICGIETEFGIVQRGVDEQNPITASSILINAYMASLRNGDVVSPDQRPDWDFDHESPGQDARGFSTSGASPPEVETHLVNAVLTNGARYYVDHAHPELSTPECTNARSIVVFDRAAEQILVESMRAADAILPPGQSIVVYKNNSDGKGNSYGCHENYLLDRHLPFGQIVRHITPHFITRQLFCGAGKVGNELGLDTEILPYQLSQRADFFEEEVGLETTLKRPIVNTRDEPHADPLKYRRLHVIIGDSNMSETATFLKVGTTVFALAMIEDNWLPTSFDFVSPVGAVRQVSADLSLRQPLALRDGTSIRAIEVQRELFERATDWASVHGFENVGGESVGADVLAQWGEVLDALESNHAVLADRVDWIAKYRVIEGYRERHDLKWGDVRLHALDLQYHDLRPEKSLASRIGLRTFCTDDEISKAKTEPPLDTRAFFRGKCLAKFPGEIISANWDSMVFDVGGDTLRKVPMMEPSRGTAAHVASVIERSTTAAELLHQLDS